MVWVVMVVCGEKSSVGRYAVTGVEYDKGAGEKMEEESYLSGSPRFKELICGRSSFARQGKEIRSEEARERREKMELSSSRTAEQLRAWRMEDGRIEDGGWRMGGRDKGRRGGEDGFF
ncbi:hypothetical protein EYF80_067369 [Liparis tanakae]|uniref:Uncharacterized protein n=1 Tax=Liparis tanakae TaxID=230148 RepID=A0A4Z2E1B3_9TELE|nr:hypothetical protein EYF80_067369 [Liparis tanakae]